MKPTASLPPVLLRQPRCQYGLTLVELLIALVLGLLLLGSLLSLHASSSQTYRTQVALSRLQENGRFALELLARELHNAGHLPGCTGVRNSRLATGHAPDLHTLFGFDFLLGGWQRTPGPYSGSLAVSGSDSLLVKYARRSSGLRLAAPLPAEGATPSFSGGPEPAAGSLVLLSAGASCDLLQNAGATTQPGNHPGTLRPLSRRHDAASEVHQLHTRLYYIGQATSSTLPGLRQRSFDLGLPAADQELVEGIVDMRLCYGIDQHRQRRADAFVPADAVSDWSRVVAVRVTLLAVSLTDGLGEGDGPPPELEDCDGHPGDAPRLSARILNERRLWRSFSTTVALRNRLP